MEIKELLDATIARKASDLHLIPGYYPSVRVNNNILFLRNFSILTPQETNELLLSILSQEQKTMLAENKEIDIGYEYSGARFRINIYTENKMLAGAFRLIPSQIKTIEELNLPSILHTFADYPQGLVLFTGPTGEGKSTTLATLINEINMKRSCHIVTIEDPVEFVYPKEKSIVSQRELQQDTLSWNIALKSVLREDPDVVLVGEMRDYDTVQSVLTIAETGHLVFSTLHTGSTSEAINRIVDVFPAHQQNQIRNSLSNTLVAVVAQRLLPDVTGTSRVPALEVLLNTPSVASIIRDGKNFMLDNVIETSEDSGMIMFEKYLAKLYHSGYITKDTALQHAIRRNLITKFIT